MERRWNMEATIIFVIIGAVIIFIIGILIGDVEKRNLERKQDYMEQLERKQQHYINHTLKEIDKLERTKREYERMLSELDRSQIPSKEQIEKLHWYMKHFGYINQHQVNQLNSFYNNNYPHNPFKK